MQSRSLLTREISATQRVLPTIYTCLHFEILMRKTKHEKLMKQQKNTVNINEYEQTTEIHEKHE